MPKLTDIIQNTIAPDRYDLPSPEEEVCFDYPVLLLQGLYDFFENPQTSLFNGYSGAIRSGVFEYASDSADFLYNLDFYSDPDSMGESVSASIIFVPDDLVQRVVSDAVNYAVRHHPDVPEKFYALVDKLETEYRD